MSPDPHEKVVWLDVSVDEVLVVHVLDATNHLVGQHQDCLHGKSGIKRPNRLWLKCSQISSHWEGFV